MTICAANVGNSELRNKGHPEKCTRATGEWGEDEAKSAFAPPHPELFEGDDVICCVHKNSLQFLSSALALHT